MNTRHLSLGLIILTAAAVLAGCGSSNSKDMASRINDIPALQDILGTSMNLMVEQVGMLI